MASDPTIPSGGHPYTRKRPFIVRVPEGQQHTVPEDCNCPPFRYMMRILEYIKWDNDGPLIVIESPDIRITHKLVPELVMDRELDLMFIPEDVARIVAGVTWYKVSLRRRKGGIAEAENWSTRTIIAAFKQGLEEVHFYLERHVTLKLPESKNWNCEDYYWLCRPTGKEDKYHLCIGMYLNQTGS